jgi:hydroxymethylbilane synthase
MPDKNKIIIGSRGSKLALCQTKMIAASLMNHHPGLVVEIIKIKTQGDKILDVPLAKIGDKGLFVKELEDALLNEQIDLAVHSLKDVPTDLPPGLIIGAVTTRENPQDILISRNNIQLQDLPPDATLGTSSLRRQAQLLHYSPRFKLVDLRGNLDTRIRKLTEQKMDGIVLAAAGVCRLGWQEKISQYLPIDICLPAVGQGALGIEIRETDQRLKTLIAPLNHPPTGAAAVAERALLKRLEGGCQVPLGAYAQVENNTLRLQGVIASVDGEKLIRDEISGKPDEAAELGVGLAERLLDAGGREILATIMRPA